MYIQNEVYINLNVYMLDTKRNYEIRRLIICLTISIFINIFLMPIILSEYYK